MNDALRQQIEALRRDCDTEGNPTVWLDEVLDLVDAAHAEPPARPKPCPFCGSAATVETNFGREWWVQCTMKPCSAGGSIMAENAHEAIAWWNRRAPSAPSAPRAQSNQSMVERFSVRIVNTLHRNGISTLKQLTDRNATELAKLEGLGTSSVKEIVAALRAHGYELASQKMGRIGRGPAKRP